MLGLLVKNVYAQVTTNVTDPVADLAIENLADIFGLIINIVIGIAIALVIVFLGLCGIQYITAKGDVKAADAARVACTNAIIGFVIGVGAVTVKVAISTTLGVAQSNSLDVIVPF